MYVPVLSNVITLDNCPWSVSTPIVHAEGNVTVCATLATVISTLTLLNVPLALKLVNASVILPVVVTVCYTPVV
jgi:hypothetical protein